MIKNLCEICDPKQWKTISTKMLTSIGYPVYGANGVIGFYQKYNHSQRTLLITCRGATCGTLNICEPYSYVNGNAMALDNLSNDVDIDFLYYYLLNRGFSDVITGSAQPQIIRQSLFKIIIEYPKLSVQKQIVSVLQRLENLIITRKQQLSKLDELVKARFVEMFGDPTLNNKKWNSKELKRISKLVSGGTPTRQHPEYFKGTIPWITTVSLGKITINENDAVEYITEKAIDNSSTKLIPANSLLFGVRVGVGKVSKNIVPMCTNQDIVAMTNIDSKVINIVFLKHLLDTFANYFETQKRGATIKGIKSDVLKNIKVILPPIELQNEFAVFVEQVEKSKKEIQQSIEKLETLKKSLMQEYFG